MWSCDVPSILNVSLEQGQVVHVGGEDWVDDGFHEGPDHLCHGLVLDVDQAQPSRLFWSIQDKFLRVF